MNSRTGVVTSYGTVGEVALSSDASRARRLQSKKAATLDATRCNSCKNQCNSAFQKRACKINYMC